MHEVIQSAVRRFTDNYIVITVWGFAHATTLMVILFPILMVITYTGDLSMSSNSRSILEMKYSIYIEILFQLFVLNMWYYNWDCTFVIIYSGIGKHRILNLRIAYLTSSYSFHRGSCKRMAY